ncbi:DUF6493 family protein [Amycolatopsis sp. NPDC048633]|uniref:DUF6493 family protein n=1 Tax=Amycolatopsis sp. NPDC048633 TaxID=3157095 RepID=UPI003404C1AB
MPLTELLTGTRAEVLERMLALSRERRAELLPGLIAALEHAAEFVEVAENTHGARDPRTAGLATTALLTALPPRDPRWQTVWPDDADLLRRALLDRPVAERAQLVPWLLRSRIGWELARELARAKEIELVRGPEYYAGWFAWARRHTGTPLAGRLREEPEALNELWELLALEGDGEASFAAFDKYVAEQDQWRTALLELVRSGEVDRARLLTSTLEVLAGDFAAFRAQWYAALHEALVPTTRERAAAQNRYARLCGSANPRTVSFAVKALLEVDKAGQLDDEVVLAHLPAAAAGRTAGAAKLAVRLAANAVKRRPELAGLADEVFQTALSHQASDVRELAAARLELPPQTPAKVVSAEYPEPVPLPWPERRMLVTPLEIPDSPAALAEACSLLLADIYRADLLLAVLDGAHRLAGQDLASALKPLVKRAVSAGGEHEEAARKLVGTLVLGLAGRQVEPPEPGQGWLRPLRHRVAALLAGTANPVGAPTHQGGWLDPVVFVRRLIDTPDAAQDDVVDGLLRLAPDTRAEAGALAAGLTGPHATAVRFALGAAEAPEPGWVGFAAARARQPEAADPAAVLRGESVPAVVWTARLGTTSWGADALDFERTPTAEEPDVPWLGLLGFGEHTGEWLGFSTPHEAVGAPYDRTLIEAAVAEDLFGNDAEAGYPTEQVCLPRYLDRPDIPGFTGALLFAAALNTKRATAAQLGVDVVLSLLEARLLGPRALGAGLAVLGNALTPTRLVKRLEVVAGEHPAAVLSIVDALLPALDRSTKGVFALLELAADLAERGAGTVSPDTREWLSGFSGSSKSAKAASRLTR